ncbi:MAG: hypothetical protein AB8B63_09340 [Granulosicoccus sp.]
MMKVIGVIAACFAALVVVGYILIGSGGKPISADLSTIGQGRPTLVLAYENFSPTGGDALNQLRKVRSDFDARLDFAVADLGTPSGRAFADKHQLFNGLAVFLAKDGQPLGTTQIAADEQTLRKMLESKLVAAD